MVYSVFKIYIEQLQKKLLKYSLKVMTFYRSQQKTEFKLKC